jgi:tetratricopeptide (TPR) repeat protein
LNPSGYLPILFLAAAVLLGPTHAAQAPGTTEPPPMEMEAEPPARVIDAQTAADVFYWEEQVAGSPGDVTVRLALGNAYAMNHRYAEAVREYRKVLGDYPESRPAWNNLGSAYRAMGRKSRALDAYRRAVKIDPLYGLAYYNIGVIYDSAGEYDRALEYYGLAFKQDPTLADPKKNPQVVTNRRVFAVLLHNYVESAGTLALPLEPAYPAPEN